MTGRYRIFLLSLFTFSGTVSFSQSALVNNNACLIYAAPHSIVKIKGSFDNMTGGLFQNKGTTTIDSSFFNNGISEKSGHYYVGKDWVNNQTFISDSSEVFLFGNNQLITGDSVSRYWILELQGTGIKTQEIESYTKHLLKLNDRELATDSYFMHVLNADTGAITRTTGFVSSLGNGKLYRDMDQAEAYLFPTGSSLNTTRYRPASLKTQTAAAHTFGVRMANNDATLDGYNRAAVNDTIFCRTNEKYYHLISREAGTDNADVRIFYDEPADSIWDGMAHWEYPVPSGEWQSLLPVQHQGNSTGLGSVTKAAWPQFTPEPFILAKIRQETPKLSGADSACGDKELVYVGDPNNPNWTYNWDIVNGSVASTPNHNTASVLWNPAGGAGSVTLTTTAPNGCNSFPVHINVIVDPVIIASFTFTPNGDYGSKPVVFDNQSQNAVHYAWDFGGQASSHLESPTHIFNFNGTHEITLIATSAAGCVDTAKATIHVIDGFFIPNIFTPNGDGVNEVFEINMSDFDNYTCYIFNRWGNLMFESSEPHISWNGISPLGQLVPAGTYFCVIEFRLPSGPYKHTGTVNVHY